MLRFRRLLEALPRSAFLLLVLSIAVVTACAPATNTQSAAPKNVHFMGGGSSCRPTCRSSQPMWPRLKAISRLRTSTFRSPHSAGQGTSIKLVLQGSVDVTTGAADAVLGRRLEIFRLQPLRCSGSVAISRMPSWNHRRFALRAISRITLLASRSIRHLSTCRC